MIIPTLFIIFLLEIFSVKILSKFFRKKFFFSANAHLSKKKNPPGDRRV